MCKLLDFMQIVGKCMPIVRSAREGLGVTDKIR
jgi:hypothetical protein